MLLSVWSAFIALNKGFIIVALSSEMPIFILKTVGEELSDKYSYLGSYLVKHTNRT